MVLGVLVGLSAGSVLAACSSSPPRGHEVPHNGSTTTQSSTTLPPTTTTAALGTAPMSGDYVDGADGTPHYFVTLSAQPNGSLTGSVQFLAQDGNTNVAFSFSGTWRAGVAILTPGGGTAQNVPSSISMPFSSSGLSLGGCTGYLQFATSQASCQFSFNGSQI
jgi:hypothetical protein